MERKSPLNFGSLLFVVINYYNSNAVAAAVNIQTVCLSLACTLMIKAYIIKCLITGEMDANDYVILQYYLCSIDSCQFDVGISNSCLPQSDD